MPTIAMPLKRAFQLEYILRSLLLFRGDRSVHPGCFGFQDTIHTDYKNFANSMFWKEKV
jgi:hypothetical protein